MNPVFTVSSDNNLHGVRYEEFYREFDQICQNHLKSGRARAFAFIVYNFHSATHEALRDTGVFVELDRLSGKDITIFYLDGVKGRKKDFQNTLFHNFNQLLVEMTNKTVQSIPFIAFFDFENGEVKNFDHHPIRDNSKFILSDLKSALNKKISELRLSGQKEKTKSISKTVTGILSETPKIVYGEFVGVLLQGLINR